MDLTQILEATLSPDSQAIRLAEQQLQQAAQANLAGFLTALANELADINKSEVARVAAGLQLKNYLTSKSPEVRLRYQRAWLAFDLSIRNHIKNMVLQTLGTETQQHRAASQCIAYIAAVELPANTWPELIQTLLGNVTNPQATENLKESSLEAIGYVCEEVDHKWLAHLANEILTAIVQGMRKEETSNRVRLAATKALLNSLEFTKANFEKETERHFIMQVVCEATQCNCVPVQVAALQNLVKIMSLYYQHMESYMGPALFAITLEAMKSNTDEIALQGIEFWSTVCDEEADLQIEAAEAEDLGRPPQQVSRFYVKGALQYLVPILMITLAKQEEFDDEDDWNPCKAAGVCLSLMATCCEDQIVPLVLPFALENLMNQDWKFRDAAVMAVGSILEGPDPTVLQEHLSGIINTLLDLMSDTVVQVSDSAAWTVGRVCEHSPSTVLNDTYLLKLLQKLTEGLSGEPRVATNVCWAFSSLAEAAFEAAVETCGSDEPQTFCLSPSFEVIVGKLIQTTDRSDSGTGNLRSSAYEALMDMIKYSAKDCYPVVQKTTLVIMERLQHVLKLDSQVQGADRQQLADLESLLCATLQSLLRKVSSEDALKIADAVMEALLMMFSSSSGQTGGVQEDAIMTVGVLVEAIEGEFLRYMEVFKSYLFLALNNHIEYQVCLASVGLVGDLCRSLKGKVLPYCDEIMAIFIANLSNSEVHRSIKPQILSTIGDIGLAIGDGFQKYLNVVLGMLNQVVELNTQLTDSNDYDTIDYLNELREGCLEAYTGILQGLKGEDDTKQSASLEVLETQVPAMIKLIDFIAKDEDRTDSTIACSAGLLGDLCSAYGKRLLSQIINVRVISDLVAEGRKSRIKRTKALSQWAFKELKQLQSW